MIDTLYPAIDNQTDSFVVIFAMYPEFVEPFMALDPGLKRRTRHTITFPDYSDDELTLVLYNQVQETERFYVARELLSLVARNIERKRGTEGFGNAAAVTTTLNTAVEQWSLRATKLPSGTRA